MCLCCKTSAISTTFLYKYLLTQNNSQAYLLMCRVFFFRRPAVAPGEELGPTSSHSLPGDAGAALPAEDWSLDSKVVVHTTLANETALPLAVSWIRVTHDSRCRTKAPLSAHDRRGHIRQPHPRIQELPRSLRRWLWWLLLLLLLV